jgi:glycosyltransferase involved in cell wall biosynthesis
MRIALMGTRGVPARYGGFETAVEEIGRRLATRGHEVVVYCRNDGQAVDTHLGMRLVNLPALRFKQTETLSHTALSVGHLAVHPCDVALVFNVANAPLVAGIKARRIPVALHVDGLEWKRAKWSGTAKRYFMLAERVGVRIADRLIADARAIQAYYRSRHGVASRFIPYGAPILARTTGGLVTKLGVDPGRYHLAVARFEPENNIELIVTAYAESACDLPLVVVGDAPHADKYGKEVRARASGRDVRFTGSIWDQALLDQLYEHAALYTHGHSVGGTNPSLLRAMGARAPIAAYDVEFNREVLGDTGQYFATPAELAKLMELAESNPDDWDALGLAAQHRAASEYDWERVVDDYEELCRELIQRRRKSSRRVSGR